MLFLSKKIHLNVLVIFTVLLLAGCKIKLAGPPPSPLPRFVIIPTIYAVDNGRDVAISVFVKNSLQENIYCFARRQKMQPLRLAYMSDSGTYQLAVNGYGLSIFSGVTAWYGVASYSQDLPNKTGSNDIVCEFQEDSGKITGVAAKIIYVPNVPPTLVVNPDITVCAGKSFKIAKEQLIDSVSSQYLEGAIYSKGNNNNLDYIDYKSWPSTSSADGWDIQQSTGELVGYVKEGDYANLTITAKTPAGVDTSEPFTLHARASACEQP